MKVLSKFFWIISALYLGNKVKANIRGIAGVDFPNYSTIPKTSFKCSEQQFNPGFYADVETRCQVFHHCYNHRKESFLCPPGTIYNQPIKSCDYWYSSECNLAPSFYHLNALNGNNEIDDFTVAPDEIPTNNVFEKISALYDSKENSEESSNLPNDQSLIIDEHIAGYNKEINQDSATFFNDEHKEIERLEYSESGDPMDFSLNGNSESMWGENENHSYKINTDKFSPGIMSEDGFTQEQLLDYYNPQYEEESDSKIQFTKRLSELEMNSKINRLRRRPQYTILQTTEEIVSPPEKENYNVATIYSSEDAPKEGSSITSIAYEVPFKYSTDSYEVDQSVIRLQPVKTKRKRKPITILPDNLDNQISTTVSTPKEDISIMPGNIFDTYLPIAEVAKPPSRRKPILMQDEHKKEPISLSTITPIPLEASNSDLISTTDLKDTSESYEFLHSTEAPTFETTTISDWSDVFTTEDELSNEPEDDLFHEENISEGLYKETDVNIELVEQENFDSGGTEVIDTKINSENKYHSMSFNDLENVRQSEKFQVPEFLSNSTFSPIELDKHILLQNEYATEGSFENFEEMSSVNIPDNSALQYLDTDTDQQANHLSSELQTNLTAGSVEEYKENNHISSGEMLAVNTLSPIENTESVIEEQNLLHTQYDPEWMDEKEFLSLLEMSGGAINESTDNAYYEYEYSDELDGINYDVDENEVFSKPEFANTSNLDLEGIRYTDHQYYPHDSSPSFHVDENTDETLGISQQNKVNKGTINIPSDSVTVENSSDEEFIPQTAISENVMPNVPSHLNAKTTPQKLKETISDVSISQTSDKVSHEILIATSEKIHDVNVGNETSTNESNIDDLMEKNTLQEYIDFNAGDTHLKKVVGSEIGNEIAGKEVSESTFIQDATSLPKVSMWRELSGISQTKPVFKEKDIQENLELKPSTSDTKINFQPNSQLQSNNINNNYLPKPQLQSNNLNPQIPTEKDLSKPLFKSNGTRVSTSGKSLQKSQFPSRGKNYLTKTVGKSQFTSVPPLRNMQMLLSTYLSDTGVDDSSLYSSRSGSLFKFDKVSKAIAFGKKLLAMKRAKYNILKRYVASYNRERSQ